MEKEENLVAPPENAEAAKSGNSEIQTTAAAPDGAAAEIVLNEENPPQNEVDLAGEVVPSPKVFGDKPVNRRKKTVLRWIIMSVGIFMMACSVYFFQTPNDITLGGMAGAALLLHYAFPSISQGVFLNIINAGIIILGLIVLGKQCTVRTIYCSFLYTGLILGMEYVIGNNGQPIPIPMPVTGGEVFLELCYAIILFGIGGALVFNCGASSGGTDILALILKKFTNLNVGVSLAVFDALVVIISIFSKSTTASTMLYSFMGVFAKTFILDGVIEGIGKTKYITIITQHPDEICDYILNVIKHSYTIYDAEGGYSKEPNKIIATVCKRGEAWKLKHKIKELDSKAFVIVTDANEILGKGFDASF